MSETTNDRPATSSTAAGAHAGSGESVPRPANDPKRPAPPPGEGLFARWADPRAFLVGLLVAFAACVLAGRASSQRSPYRDVKRFHASIGPESNFFPTASQLAAHATRHARPDDVIVIVGGNSVFYGTTQPPDDVWTDRLQQALGPPFRVVNLAFRGSNFAEGGAVIAEMLHKRGRRVIYVANVAVCRTDDPLQGRYQYLFWDAYYRGALLDDPTRAADVAVAIERADREPGARDLIRGQRLNGLLYFNDLWTEQAYKRFGTTWGVLTRGRMFSPRKTFVDQDHTPPLEARYSPATLDIELRIVGAWAAGMCMRDPATGDWVPDPNATEWINFDRQDPRTLPPAMRERTLLAVVVESPYYRRRLPADVQRQYVVGAQETARRHRQFGYHAVDVGLDFTDEDYGDRCHLAPAGGAKVAAALAPRVREMAKSLGYTQ